MKIYLVKKHKNIKTYSGTEIYEKEFIQLIPDCLNFLPDPILYSGIRFCNGRLIVNKMNNDNDFEYEYKEITKENLTKPIIKKLKSIKRTYTNQFNNFIYLGMVDIIIKQSEEEAIGYINYLLEGED